MLEILPSVNFKDFISVSLRKKIKICLLSLLSSRSGQRLNLEPHFKVSIDSKDFLNHKCHCHCDIAKLPTSLGKNVTAIK